MISRCILAGALSGLFINLAGCDRHADDAPSAAVESDSVPAAVASPATDSQASTQPPPVPLVKLDPEMLASRSCPEVINFYASALHARLFGAAAQAWQPDAGVTASHLEAAYGKARAGWLQVDSTRIEGAAGSAYCIAAVTHLRNGQPAGEGTLTLRRANEAPGASPEQSRWRIVESTFGETAREGEKPATR